MAYINVFRGYVQFFSTVIMYVAKHTEFYLGWLRFNVAQNLTDSETVIP
jgi:hypothetical protein